MSYKYTTWFGLTESNIRYINPLNAELNPICHLLALLGGATIVVVSRLRVNTKNTHMEKISSKYISRKWAPYFYNCCHVQTFHTIIEYV